MPMGVYERKLPDLTGKKFGKWTVLGKIVLKKGWRNGQNYIGWHCICECENHGYIVHNYLVRGTSKQCVNCARKMVAKGNRKNEFDVEVRTLMAGYRHNAKKRGLQFSLTEDEFAQIIIRNCTYCNRKGKIGRKLRRRELSKFFFNGIDRIDNNYGYFPLNCVPCCFKCNEMKRAMTAQEWQDLLFAIALVQFQLNPHKFPQKAA